MAPVRNRSILSHLILASLFAWVSLPSLIAVANTGPIAQPTGSKLEQSDLINRIAEATTTEAIAPDLAPAIAQLKANNPVAAAALLLKLQAQSPGRDRS